MLAQSVVASLPARVDECALKHFMIAALHGAAQRRIITPHYDLQGRITSPCPVHYQPKVCADILGDAVIGLEVEPLRSDRCMILFADICCGGSVLRNCLVVPNIVV